MRRSALLVATVSACWTGAPTGPSPRSSVSTPAPVEDGMLRFDGGVAWCDAGRGATCAGAPLPPFSIDATPVRREMYERCVGSGVCTRSGYPPQPTSINPHVEIEWQNGVTYEQAARFCDWRKARLPTEPEWNHAFRAAADRFEPVRTTSGNEGEWIDGWYAGVRLVLVELRGGSYRFGATATIGAAGRGFRCARAAGAELAR